MLREVMIWNAPPSFEKVEKDRRRTEGKGIRTSPDPNGAGAQDGGFSWQACKRYNYGPVTLASRVRCSASAITGKGAL